MNATQKAIKYLAIALAVLLIVSIVNGIVGILRAFDYFFSNDTDTKDATVYTVSSAIHTVEMEIGGAEVRIEQGDSFSVVSNLKGLTVKENRGVLTVKEKKLAAKISHGAFVTLYLPADTVLEHTDITTGAGSLTVEHLKTETLRWVLGAGMAEADCLTVTRSAEIHGGAGKITVLDGSIHHLDLEMGIGQLNLRAALPGEAELSLGIGESNITVIGEKDDYRLDIEKGLGEITLDGVSVGNVEKYGDGDDRIEIQGGIGSVNLSFEAADGHIK